MRRNPIRKTALVICLGLFSACYCGALAHDVELNAASVAGEPVASIQYRPTNERSDQHVSILVSTMRLIKSNRKCVIGYWSGTRYC